MRKTIKLSLVIGIALLMCVAIVLIIKLHPINRIQNNEKLEVEDEMETFIDRSPLNGSPIQDNVAVYANDIDDSVKHIYITTLSTIDEKTGETVTLTDINQLDQYYEDYNPEIQIIFQEGDENGPYSDIFTPQSTQGNAVMRARGFSARKSPQKSFKIKLNNNTELFLNQSTLNMNKHFFDKLRITNKLCFDLFESIPNFTSMRTQFVNIYIKDISKREKEIFENYGLFTMIEQPNKLFLKTHGLDKNGNLYKAQNFSFTSRPELLNENDPKYDKNEFEKILEIKEGKDHTKLLNMIKDVENVNLDINVVINEHFNRDNYLTWLAVNIMFGNLDVTSSNFLLYSPINSKTWYFLPWDYDGSLYYSEYERVANQEYPEMQYGIGMYWGVPMHRRFLKDPQNIEELSQKIQELRQDYITKEKIEELTQLYKEVIKKYSIEKLPDIQYLALPADKLLEKIDNLDTIVEGNIERYYKNLECPMPIWMNQAEINNDGTIEFMWENSYDLQADQVTYQLQIARDFEFNYLVFDGEEQLENHYTLSIKLPKDKYYFRVIIYDEHGHTQLSMEEIQDNQGNYHRGMSTFEVQ